MTRLVLLVALAALSAQAFEVSNTVKGFNKTPLQNNIAYKFFEAAVEDETTESGSPFNDGVYNYEHCKTEAALILEAMNNFEEWGLQCEYIVQFNAKAFEHFGYLIIKSDLYSSTYIYLRVK